MDGCTLRDASSRTDAKYPGAARTARGVAKPSLKGPDVTKPTCSVDGCETTALARGLCSRHYQRVAKYGTADLPERSDKPPCPVDGCGRPYYAYGMCQMHRRRMLLRGTAERRPTKREMGVAFLAGLSMPTEGCVTWPFSRFPAGYGRIDAMGERFAHRVSARIHIGEPSDAYPLVLHACGKGHEGCVAPWHLYYGDFLLNAKDRDRHGTTVTGSRSPHAKLTEADIAPIRADLRSNYEVSLDYRVTPGAIWMVRNHYSWKHVT
jgi:hypothetical protein